MGNWVGSIIASWKKKVFSQLPAARTGLAAGKSVAGGYQSTLLLPVATVYYER
jgi:hypothetical protein